MKNIIISFAIAIISTTQLLSQFHFTTFGEIDGLPDKTCRGLAVDANGTLWIGTQEGMAKLENASIIPVPVPDGVAEPYVNVVKVAPDGNIWLGYFTTQGGGVSVIDPAGNLLMHADTAINGEGGTFVNDIEFGPDGLTYLAVKEGIATFNGEDWTLEVPTSTNFAAAPVWDIEFADDGSMWAGTIFGLAHLQANGQWVHYFSLSTDLIHDDVRTLKFGPMNRLWIGTSKGLSIFDGQNFENYWLTEGLPSEFIRDIAFDDEGKAWLMTDDGFSIFDEMTFENYKTYEHPFIGNRIENVVIHPTVGTWLATREGLVKVEEGVSSAFGLPATWLGKVQIFPVPAADRLELRWDVEVMGNLEAIRLLNMQGQPLRQLLFDKSSWGLTIDLSNYPAGQYLLVFEMVDGHFSKTISKI